MSLAISKRRSFTSAVNSLIGISKYLFFVFALSVLGASPGLANVVRDNDSIDAKATKTPLYEWTDGSQKATAIVVTVHGATQQAACFEVLARQLAEKGFLVCSIDLRGQWPVEIQTGTLPERIYD